MAYQPLRTIRQVRAGFSPEDYKWQVRKLLSVVVVLFGVVLLLFVILPRLLDISPTLTDYSRWLLRLVGLESEEAVNFLVALLAALILLHFILISVLFIVLALRKVIAFVQFRLGPRRVGFHGAAQTVADAIKLMVKEDVIPAKADRWIFTIAPMLVFIPAFLVYVVLPWGGGYDPSGIGNNFIARDLNIGILYVVAITSIAVVGIIMAGWASDNKYALLGALRSAAQLVSYEVPGVIAVLGPVILAGSLSMQSIVNAQGYTNWFKFVADNITKDQLERGWFLQWYFFQPFGLGILGFIAYFISALAETNTTPFDLPEAESELVAGFNTEYSGMKFAFFFLAEFSNTFVVSGIAATLFFGGWHAPFPFLPDYGWWGVLWFFLKASFGVFVFMWIRATWPRVRVDQLMEFAWKFVVPLAIIYVMGVAYVVAVTGWGKHV